MSVTIRLARTGKKNAPTYKVVVANTRDKRNGKFLDILGYYNPQTTPAESKIDQKKYADWKAKGALTTEAVVKIAAGEYKYVKYNPKGDKKEAQQAESTPEA